MVEEKKQFRWFKTSAKKSDKIKEWPLDSKNSFKPHKIHIIRVNMKNKEVNVYSHFNMTMVKFVGNSFTMSMSKKVFYNMFTLGDWQNNWIEVTDQYENGRGQK